MVTNAVQGMQDAIANFAIDLAAKFNIAEEAAKRLIATLKSAAQQAVQATLGALPVIGPAFQARAMGGFADGMTLVGERGPEIVNLPRGSYVHTAMESQRMSENRGVRVEFNAPLVGQVIVKDEADEDRLIAKLTRMIQLQQLQSA
jgi:hypothetical protein